jgi:hypothetical protein
MRLKRLQQRHHFINQADWYTRSLSTDCCNNLWTMTFNYLRVFITEVQSIFAFVLGWLLFAEC